MNKSYEFNRTVEKSRFYVAVIVIILHTISRIKKKKIIHQWENALVASVTDKIILWTDIKTIVYF